MSNEPIQSTGKLTARIRELIEKQDFGARVEVEAGSELAPLADTVNTLLEEIEARAHTLQATEERYRLILETVPYGIRENDLEGIITYSNPAHHRMLGYEPPELIGQPIWTAVVDQKDIEWRNRLIEQIKIKPPKPEPYQTRARRRDDRIIDIQVDWNYKRNKDGKPIGFVSVITDITAKLKAERERQQLEAQLRQSQKMEALGKLAGGISHDFNNLLAAILGSCEFILKDPADAEAVKEHTVEIQKASTTAAGSTKQLLAFSRRQVMLPRVLNLNQVVRDMEKILRRLIGEHIELVGNLDDDVWPVLADPAQISQVIMNLAINARDAMPEGGKLTIATSRAFRTQLELGSSHGSGSGLTPGDHTCLSVSDAGCGMDEATRGRIFEPFFTTKGPKKGSGLGMATVYGVVTQSKGHIEIDSEPGKGTTMRIYLPRSLEEAKPATGAAINETALGQDIEHLGGSETILLVEDEAPIRTLAKRILEMYGYKLITAPDAESALEAFEFHGGLVDLVLTDVLLPGMRGPDLAEKLRITQPQLKVLYMSGYTDTDMAQQDLLEEVVGYLQKPFHSSELVRSIRRLLDGE